jgi:anti-sigma factor RsiW
MKSDVLERLLIDQAAGALSPDVAELLEDHLRHEPAAQREAAEIGETLRLARLALSSQRVIPLPRRPFTRSPVWAWAMAACFVCGLSLGIFAGRGRNDSPHIASVVSAPVHQTAAVTVSDESGFWSLRRLRAAAPPAGGKSENSIIWKSPVKKPELL